jgi:hypothetical protein
MRRRAEGMGNGNSLVLAVDPAPDEWRTSHASPSERYEDRVRYLAFGTAGGAYDGR